MKRQFLVTVESEDRQSIGVRKLSQAVTREIVFSGGEDAYVTVTEVVQDETVYTDDRTYITYFYDKDSKGAKTIGDK